MDVGISLRLPGQVSLKVKVNVIDRIVNGIKLNSQRLRNFFWSPTNHVFIRDITTGLLMIWPFFLHNILLKKLI